jgi:hypothetical protein
MADRDMTEAEVFAALCALPARFRFEVERVTSREPDWNAVRPMTPAGFEAMNLEAQIARKEAEERAMLETMRDRTFWRISLNTSPDGGPGFYGRAETLAGAWAAVLGQIAAFSEVIGL